MGKDPKAQSISSIVKAKTELEAVLQERGYTPGAGMPNPGAPSLEAEEA